LRRPVRRSAWPRPDDDPHAVAVVGEWSGRRRDECRLRDGAALEDPRRDPRRAQLRDLVIGVVAAAAATTTDRTTTASVCARVSLMIGRADDARVQVPRST
jgi:hypothetical protein